MQKADLEYMIENAEIFVISGRSGTGKSWFAKNVLKAKIEEFPHVPLNSNVSGCQELPFDRRPDWSQYRIWGIDASISLWEPNSLRAAIEKAQAELTKSQKLAFLVHNGDELERAGISLTGNICYIRFTDLGVATVNLGERRININLKANKDGSIHFIEETQIENKKTAGGVNPLIAWLVPVYLGFFVFAGFLSFKLAILLSSHTGFRVALFCAILMLQALLFHLFMKMLALAFSHYSESDI